MNICIFLPFTADVIANSADGKAEFFFQVHVNIVILLTLYSCKDYLYFQFSLCEIHKFSLSYYNFYLYF